MTNFMEPANIEEKIQYVANLINQESKARVQTYQELVQRKNDRNSMLWELNGPPWKNRFYSTYHERHPIQYLRQALDEHNGVDHNGHVITIKCLFHRLLHGRNSLAQEKRILKDIKCAQEQCQKFCVDVETKTRVPWHLQEVLKSKKSIKNHMELLFHEMPGKWRQQRATNIRSEQLKKQLEVAEKDISSLQRKLENINREKEKLYAYILELRR